MIYQKETLSNGLRIATHEMKDRDSVALGIWFNVGGRFEEDRIKGAAHFLEHIVFKGSKKYKCDQIKQLIEGVGGSLNAFTAEEQTCFYAKIPAKHLEQTFDVLADMTFFPTINYSDLEKEKTVIIEEIKMYHDLPQYHVIELLDKLIWPKHPLGKNLAGSIESVSHMSKKDLSDFHKNYYGPKNAAVIACGKVKHEKLRALAKKKFSKLKTSNDTQCLKAEDSQTKPQFSFFKKNIEQMHLALGAHGYSQKEDERYILTLLSVILGGNMSSRLFVEVREKHGLAYSICSYAKALSDTGVFMVRAGVDNEKAVKAIELILKELDRIAKSNVSQGEFTRGRDYLLGQLLIGLEDTMEHMLWLGESVMVHDSLKTMKKVIGKFKKITPSDVRRVAKEVLNPTKFNLALVGPITAKQERTLRTVLGAS